MKKIFVFLSIAALSGCAMTPEQRQNIANAMSNYHPYMLPPVQQQQAPRTTTTNCWSPSPGKVSCTSQTH